MRWTHFGGMRPGLSDAHLPPDAASYCKNCWIGKGDALYPEQSPAPVAATLYNPDGTPFKGTAASIWRSDGVWFAWDHPVFPCLDPRAYGSDEAFLYADGGKLWRMSGAWLDGGSAAKVVGIPRPQGVVKCAPSGTHAWQIPYSPISDLPAQNTPPTDTIEDGSQPGEARSYVVCFVNDQGEESAPSDPSNPVWVAPAATCALSYDGAETPRAFRWYRSVAGKDGDAAFMFVGETSAPSLTDDKDALSLGDALETIDHFSLDDQTTAPILGVARLGPTRVVAWTARDIYPSEPRLPHAFNPAARVRVPSQIIRVVGSLPIAEDWDAWRAYVLTRGKPCLLKDRREGLKDQTALYGVNPPEQAKERGFFLSEYDIDEPCLSARLACSGEGGCVYASPRGLMRLEEGKAAALTDEAFTRRGWTEMGVNPDAGALVYFRERYFLLQPQASWVCAASGYASDRVHSWSASDNLATSVWAHPKEGVYFVGAGLMLWGAGDSPMTALWSSRQEQCLEYFNPGAVQVDLLPFDAPSASVAFEKEGRGWAQVVCPNRKPMRLPRQGKSLYWRLSVSSAYTVIRVMAEKSVGDMAAPTEARGEG